MEGLVYVAPKLPYVDGSSKEEPRCPVWHSRYSVCWNGMAQSRLLESFKVSRANGIHAF